MLISRRSLVLGSSALVLTSRYASAALPTAVLDLKSTFNAKGDGVTDDTSAVQAAFTTVFRQGGLLVIPKGIYLTRPISVILSDPVPPVTIRGEAPHQSVFRRYNSSSAPMVSIGVSGSGIFAYDFSLEAVSFDSRGVGLTGPALSTTNLARAVISRVGFETFSVGWLNQGSLECRVQSSFFTGCSVGAQLTSANGVTPNLIHMDDCVFLGNTSWAVDAAYGDNIRLVQCDFEVNGTAGSIQSGAVVLRANLGSASGFSGVVLDSCWFESNLNNSMFVENNSHLRLSMRDITSYNQPGAAPYNLGQIYGVILDDVRAPNDVVNVAAITSEVRGGVIRQLNDTSTYKSHHGIQTYTGIDNG